MEFWFFFLPPGICNMMNDLDSLDFPEHGGLTMT